MKPFIEKLPLHGEESFAARIHTTPRFEVPWHQHEEAELIFHLEGEGLCKAGNYIGHFREGDLFFLGARLPHNFEKKDPNSVVSAVVIHFREDLWGPTFLELPENRPIRELFLKGKSGLRINPSVAAGLKNTFVQLTRTEGPERMLLLLHCLLSIARSHSNEQLSGSVGPGYFNWRDQERIDKVYQYTLESFKEKIQLETVAALAGMTVPAFCNYFKKRTRQTYVDFVNEIRIGYAGRLLQETDNPIIDICHASGFNSLAHFNRQFRKIKGLTPSEYRRHQRHDSVPAGIRTDTEVRILEEM